MSADLAARGRIGRDPDTRETKSGDPMALSSMAVDITGYGAEPQTLWLGLVAFGKVAERLAKVRKGDTVSVHGQFTQKPYEVNGEQRPGFSLLVESLISHRPKVGKKKATSEQQGADESPVFDDSLSF